MDGIRHRPLPGRGELARRWISGAGDKAIGGAIGAMTAPNVRASVVTVATVGGSLALGQLFGAASRAYWERDEAHLCDSGSLIEYGAASADELSAAYASSYRSGEELQLARCARLRGDPDWMAAFHSKANFRVVLNWLGGAWTGASWCGFIAYYSMTYIPRGLHSMHNRLYPVVDRKGMIEAHLDEPLPPVLAKLVASYDAGHECSLRGVPVEGALRQEGSAMIYKVSVPKASHPKCADALSSLAPGDFPAPLGESHDDTHHHFDFDLGLRLPDFRFSDASVQQRVDEHRRVRG